MNKTFIKTHSTYLACFFLFLLIGAGILMNIEQGDIVWYFNDRRSPQTDFFFKYFTKVGEEFSYIIVITCFMFVRFRYALLAFLSGIGALIFSYVLKSYFRHPRPQVYFQREGLFDQIQVIDGVHLLTGSMSFPSGHTASGFALFGIVAFLIARHWSWQVVIFLTALLVGLSRIYLVQHFLKDVYFGAIVGTFIAIGLYLISNRFPYNPNRWIDRSFVHKKPPVT